MVLDGKKLSQELCQEIKIQIQNIVEKSRRPGLAVVIVGDDKASKVYVASKIKHSKEIGFYSEEISFPENVAQERLEQEIKKLNMDDNIHGILVQLPLPKHLNTEKIIELIKPEKDVDCFTKTNIGKLFLDSENSIAPCTPAGIIELLQSNSIEIQGKDITIIGRSNIVGKPLLIMLTNLGGTVTICHSKTKNISEKTRNADIVIVAVGKKDFLTEDMVKNGVIVIDVGINRVDGKLYGDVNYEGVSKKSKYITPVPGGIGPMTIAMLFKNCLKLYNKIEVGK